MVGPKKAIDAAIETVGEVADAAESTVRDATTEAERRVHELGAFIREQRVNAKLSGRNLAKRAGVSNPYLSQIERGLRKPSAEILQSIAKALRISAETLYVKAGILEERDSDVVAAITADPDLLERHKRSLLDIYRSFLAETVVEPQTQEPADSAASDAASAK
ncbi:helix-turn-helix domain-containing protein [Euzebya tangerina]|uniref:helix-turn-helix domain-containing protein n=1 Tax=Euzebya tangerina TaxID=591198 RepID=UPI000E318457|nr:helix-turn-helix transcriptional regulator [Euzebya tangerina]